MSPSTSCFSFVTSSATLPDSTVTFVHLGSWRVEDTTYLGRLFNRSAHSPGRVAHRAPNHSSLRRPSRRAAAPSASAYATFRHSSRSLAPYLTNQPPRLKPSPPSGSWTTPSSDTFVLMTIFPMFGSPSCELCQLPLPGLRVVQPNDGRCPDRAGQPMRNTPRRRETGRPRTTQFASGPWHHVTDTRSGERKR